MDRCPIKWPWRVPAEGTSSGRKHVVHHWCKLDADHRGEHECQCSTSTAPHKLPRLWAEALR